MSFFNEFQINCSMCKRLALIIASILDLNLLQVFRTYSLGMAFHCLKRPSELQYCCGEMHRPLTQHMRIYCGPEGLNLGSLVAKKLSPKNLSCFSEPLLSLSGCMGWSPILLVHNFGIRVEVRGVPRPDMVFQDFNEHMY